MPCPPIMKDCWMTLSELEDKRIAIWGLGREGLASYHLLRRHFPDKYLLLIDGMRPKNLPDDDHISFVLQDGFEQQMEHLDVVIKAPGISLYHPLITKLRQHNIGITSATNIWFAERRQATVIAITGSAGKSTTAALLTHVLKHIGFKTQLGGNIGTPLLSLDGDADYYVVELSSYQTADLRHPADIAVLLNLYPEHIDWHKSHTQYFADKCRLVTDGAGICLLNRTDPRTNDILRQPPESTKYYNDPATIHADSQYIYAGGKILGPVSEINLPGAHNRENICAVLMVCRELNLDLKECFAWAAGFCGLPHRLENLGKFHEKTYINDSIATTPEATLAALKSLEGKSITLLAGGQDRHQNYGELVEYIRDHAEITVITAYESGPKLHAALENAGVSSIMPADDLKDSVGKAQKITPKGGFILLSPAAPSYDSFNNFEQRGDFFRKFAGSNLLTSSE